MPKTEENKKSEANKHPEPEPEELDVIPNLFSFSSCYS